MDLFIHDLAFQWGGAESTFSALASKRDGHIRVVAGDLALIRSKTDDLNATVMFPCIKSNLMARASVPLLSAALPSLPPMQGRVTVSSFAVAAWMRAVERRVVYCHAPMRQIWHGREMYSARMAPQDVALRIFGPWLRRVDRWSRDGKDVVVVPSERIARLYEQIFGSPVRAVIPPPIEPGWFGEPLRQPADHFVWVGRIVEPVKRLRFLLDLFKLRPMDRLVVVGDGRDRLALESAAPGNVRFVGWQNQDSVREWVGSARALLLPSMEDFGVVAAEAMAVGVPTVLTESAGCATWFQGDVSRGLVVPASVDRFAWAIDAVNRGELGNRSEIRECAASEFSIDIFRRRMDDVYRDIGWISR